MKPARRPAGLARPTPPRWLGLEHAVLSISNLILMLSVHWPLPVSGLDRLEGAWLRLLGSG